MHYYLHYHRQPHKVGCDSNSSDPSPEPGLLAPMVSLPSPIKPAKLHEVTYKREAAKLIDYDVWKGRGRENSGSGVYLPPSC